MPKLCSQRKLNTVLVTINRHAGLTNVCVPRALNFVFQQTKGIRSPSEFEGGGYEGDERRRDEDRRDEKNATLEEGRAPHRGESYAIAAAGANRGVAQKYPTLQAGERASSASCRKVSPSVGDGENRKR